MDTSSIITAVVSCASAVSLIVGIIVAFNTLKSKNSEQAERLARIESDLRYLKDAMDRINISALNERLVIIEQKTVRAHERIDDLQHRMDKLEKGE